MIIDMHAHIWEATKDRDKSYILKAMDRYKINKTFISALYGGANPTEQDIKNGNNDVFDFINQEPSKIYGYIYVNPLHDNSLKVLEEGICKKNIIGMKLWIATTCDHEKVEPLVAYCQKHNKPILIHSFKKAVGQMENETIGINLRNLALKFPKAKFIMAHLGGIYINGISACKDLDNVYYDISGTINERDALIYALKHLSPNRILFGTDAPLCYISTLSQIEELSLSDEIKDMIYYKNSENLFLDRKEL